MFTAKLSRRLQAIQDMDKTIQTMLAALDLAEGNPESLMLDEDGKWSNKTEKLETFHPNLLLLKVAMFHISSKTCLQTNMMIFRSLFSDLFSN